MKQLLVHFGKHAGSGKYNNLKLSSPNLTKIKVSNPRRNSSIHLLTFPLRNHIQETRTKRINQFPNSINSFTVIKSTHPRDQPTDFSLLTFPLVTTPPSNLLLRLLIRRTGPSLHPIILSRRNQALATLPRVRHHEVPIFILYPRPLACDLR